MNFPEPAVADGHEDWALLASDVSLETDDEARDGAMEENAPLLGPGNLWRRSSSTQRCRMGQKSRRS